MQAHCAIFLDSKNIVMRKNSLGLYYFSFVSAILPVFDLTKRSLFCFIWLVSRLIFVKEVVKISFGTRLYSFRISQIVCIYCRCANDSVGIAYAISKESFERIYLKTFLHLAWSLSTLRKSNLQRFRKTSAIFKLFFVQPLSCRS